MTKPKCKDDGMLTGLILGIILGLIVIVLGLVIAMLWKRMRRLEQILVEKRPSDMTQMVSC